ncbi:hypothetical protein BJX65DRAFT_55789 [Aspergillus insuetus]
MVSWKPTAISRGHSPLPCLQTAIPQADPALAMPLHPTSITYRVTTEGQAATSNGKIPALLIRTTLEGLFRQLLVTNEYNSHNYWKPGIGTIFCKCTTRIQDKDSSLPRPRASAVSSVGVDEAPRWTFGGNRFEISLFRHYRWSSVN